MSRLRRYRVTLDTWASQSTIVKAKNAEAAEEVALDLWESAPESVFDSRDGGVSGTTVEPLDQEGGR